MIDVHCHYYPERYTELITRLSGRGQPRFPYPTTDAADAPRPKSNSSPSAGASIEDSVLVLHLIVRALPFRFPDVRYAIPHFGGLIPMQLQRLDNQLRSQHPDLPEKPSETARRLYYDTVGHGSQPALHCAWQAFGPRHLVTGSDYPFLMDYESYAETFAYISRSALPPEDIEHVMHHSAAALFDRSVTPA
jgi:6-methylsalicylate decarboxylase